MILEPLLRVRSHCLFHARKNKWASNNFISSPLCPSYCFSYFFSFLSFLFLFILTKAASIVKLCKHLLSSGNWGKDQHTVGFRHDIAKSCVIVNNDIQQACDVSEAVGLCEKVFHLLETFKERKRRIKGLSWCLPCTFNGPRVLPLTCTENF